jgi:hypothetical protein
MIKRLLIAALAAASLCAQTPSFEGNWQGTLEAGITKLRLGVHITRAPDGKFTSTFDSIDQGAIGVPVASTTVSNGNLHLDLGVATFDGKLRGDGASIEGTFTQGVELPLVLKRVAAVEAPPERPQTPRPPFRTGPRTSPIRTRRVE